MCATCTSTWTVAALAQRRACGVAEEATGVLCEHISRFQIPILVSRFTEALQVGDSSFLCADYRMKREFTRTIPDSYFSLRAPASVHWVL